MPTCIICKNNILKKIWHEKIRKSAKKFTKKKEKIFQCSNCDLVFLENKRKSLEDLSKTRNIFNKDNSIKEFLKFHTPREIKKLNEIKKFTHFKNKKVLESGCGGGIVINSLKNETFLTAGLDNNIYRKYVESNGHTFFKSINEIRKKKLFFDIILSLAELEHKYDPLKFIINLKKILSNKGIIIFRIPNFNNIYKYLLGYNFFKYDYRISHNYYFSEKNLDILFNKLGFKVIKKVGLNEYSFDHLLNYIFFKKRVKTKGLKKYFDKKDNLFVKKNVENSLTSTSLLYIIAKK